MRYFEQTLLVCVIMKNLPRTFKTSKWVENPHTLLVLSIHDSYKPKCSVHLPRKNIFCPHKKFCPRLRSAYLLMKWMENDFLATDKIFPTLKSHFQSISQANVYFFSLGQNFLSRTKLVLSGTKNILSGTKDILSRTKNILSGQMDRA